MDHAALQDRAADHLFPSEILNRLAGDDRQLRQRVERNFYRLAKTGILAKDHKGRYYRDEQEA